jgi:hypothetical protein
MNLHLLPVATIAPLWIVPLAVGLLLIGVSLLIARKVDWNKPEGKETKQEGRRAGLVVALATIGALVALFGSAIVGVRESNDVANSTSHANDTRLIQAAKQAYGINLPREAALQMLLQGHLNASAPDYLLHQQKLGTGTYLQDGVVYEATLYHIGHKWLLVDPATKVELDPAN